MAKYEAQYKAATQTCAACRAREKEAAAKRREMDAAHAAALAELNDSSEDEDGNDGVAMPAPFGPAEPPPAFEVHYEDGTTERHSNGRVKGWV